jgi:Fur family ferric uptake transcriptional regulator
VKSNTRSTEATLHNAGLRRTPVRIGVLDLLSKSDVPLGVPEMLEKLPEHTDAVTVYRTLNTFTRKKLVHRVRGEDQTWRYALSGTVPSPQHQHPHFVCQDCGKVECLHNSQVTDRVVKSLNVDPKYTVGYAEVVLHGLCPKCQT